MSKFKYIAFYKPYGVLCQFTSDEHNETLANFNLPKDVYPAGRLDKDSEGLLLLTNDGVFNQKVANPSSFKEKTYWVQVENIPSVEALSKLSSGVVIQKYKTRPSKVRQISPPDVPERNPPIRKRKNIPTCWLELKISEGKNRQVRKMTAAVGHPTLRLIRVAVGKYNLRNIKPGQWLEITKEEVL